MNSRIAPSAAANRFSREKAAGYTREVTDETHFVVIGAGALGNWIMMLLAQIGCRIVTVIDPGRFDDPSNAPRSPFFQWQEPKARAVAAGASRMCTAASRSAYRYAVQPIQALGDAIFVDNCKTVVVAAVDCVQARLWIAERTWALGVPLVEGGFRADRWNASITMNASEDEPCWACGQGELSRKQLFSCDTYSRQIQDAGFIPATAPTAASLASFMIDEAVKLMHGDHSLANCLVSAQLHRSTLRVMRRSLDPECSVDHRIDTSGVPALQAGPDATVDELLSELSSTVSEPVIELPAPFVRAAPCLDCREACAVQQPAWQIREHPRCRSCGGPFERTNQPPEQLWTVASDCDATIRALTLQQLGLGAGLHLRVRRSSAELTVRLGGTLNRLVHRANLGNKPEHRS